MEIGTVRQVTIEQEMQQSYLDYAMSVIVSRALPDVRDGLKPVQRRILYAMYDMGMSHDKPYKKSARIVGEVLGKYHPHGDAAVYEAMVRMAQDFSLRYLLVDGQGNFGSIDGDGAAAMRYTEARLHVITQELLADIEKGTVNFVPNFDGTLKEPSALPSALPNLLVNGASGIAVGMATNIPPHNLGEVCDALVYLIDRWNKVEDVSTEELLQFIQGPDFPTGGVVYRYAAGDGAGEKVDALESAYAVGKGRFTVQGKAHVEEWTRGRNRIIVTELPYQVNKSHLIERIAELARDGRIEGISDLRDESDRQGLRVVIEVSRTAEPRDVLSALFKLTPMQMTFGMTMLALVDGEPKMLSLKRVLQLFLEHRREIVTRRSRHDLEKAKLRAHILEGLLVALSNLDEVIALIRRSQTAETAHANLRKRFKLTDIQAQAILEMQLRRLAALERKKIDEEYAEKKKLIAYLEDLLAHPKKVLGLIRGELTELRTRYADPRRTQIAQREKHDLTTRELVAEEGVVLAASGSGKLRYFPLAALPSLAKEAGDEAIVSVSKGNTRDDLLACTRDGQAYTMPMHRLPGGDRSAWTSLADLCALEKASAVVSVACLAATDEGQWPGFLTLVTRQAKVKRVTSEDLRGLRGGGTVIGLDEGDQVVGAFRTEGTQEIVVFTAQGQAIRFGEDEVRPMGLPAGGVMAIKLADGDEVVGALPVIAGAQAALVTRLGYGKRTPLAEFPAQKRHGGGIVACKVAQRTGPVAGVALIGGGEPLLIQTSQGRALTMPAGDLPRMGRGAQGNIVTKLRKGEEAAGLASLSPEPIVGGKPGRAKKAMPKAEKPSTPAPKRAAEPAKKAKVAPVKKGAAKTERAEKPTRKAAPSKKAAPKAGRAAMPAKRQKADRPAKAGTPPKVAGTPKKGDKLAAAKTSQAPKTKPAPGAKKRASKPRPVAKPKPAVAAKGSAPAPKAQEVKAVAPVTQPKSKPVSPALPLKKKPSGAQKAGSDKAKKGVVRSVKK